MTGRFLTVACGECEHEATIFDRASTVVTCSECDAVLAEPTGGKATLFGEVVEIVEER